MELTFNGHKAAIDRTLDWKTGGLIALSICGLLVGGQLLNIPLWALAALPAALAIGLATISSPRASLYVFAGTLFGLELRMRTTSQTDPLDIIAGAALMGIMAGTAIKLWLVERKQVSVDIPQLLFFLFFAWGTVTGIAGIFSWTNTWNSWIREITIYSPLLVVPILLTHYPLDDQREFSAFLKFLFWAALLSTIWMQFRYVLNVKSAIYAYEITRLSFDASSAMILLIACVASATFSLTWLKSWQRFPISLISVAAIVLSGYRTIWVSTIVMIGILLFLADKQERKHGIKFLLQLGVLLGTIGTVLFFSFPIFKIFVILQTDRFLSTSTAAVSDPSLINRFVETGQYLDYFYQSPITGYGFGARFDIFDLLLGYTHSSVSYAHNGYSFVLAKSGIVGFCLLYGAFLTIMYKILMIARDRTIKRQIRAIGALGFAFLVHCLITNYTLNSFFARSGLLWISLVWAFTLWQGTKKKHQLQLRS